MVKLSWHNLLKIAIFRNASLTYREDFLYFDTLQHLSLPSLVKRSLMEHGASCTKLGGWCLHNNCQIALTGDMT